MQRQRGLTLLELMVVLLIIGFATTGVTLALRDTSQTQLEREAQRLVAKLEAARARSRTTRSTASRRSQAPPGPEGGVSAAWQARIEAEDTLPFEAFRERYLSNPKDPNAFEGRAIVFDGPEDYHHRIDDHPDGARRNVGDAPDMRRQRRHPVRPRPGERHVAKDLAQHGPGAPRRGLGDRKSTRLNSSH